ncbi:MAG: DNA polymerase III subunit delta, partial [Nitrospirales bacterium]
LVRRELEKLAALVPEGAVAGPDEVEALRGGEPGASVFDLTAAIGARDAARALRILARNLEAGEAPLRILGSLLWQYRRLWKAKELTQRGTSDLARALGIPPFRVKDFVAQVRMFSEAHLRTAFQWFAETDSKLKGGSAGSPERVLQVLLLRLCEGKAEAVDAGQPGGAATPSPPPIRPQPEGTPRTPARRGGTKAIPTVRTVRTIRSKEPPAR